MFSVEQALDDCQENIELDIIEKEATAAGFSKPTKTNQKDKKQSAKEHKPLPPREYLSADGFTILIGRNNKQNDRLSLKQAHADDIWLHAQKTPGSHALIVAQGKTIPISTINEAAGYAAWFSKARESGKKQR